MTFSTLTHAMARAAVILLLGSLLTRYASAQFNTSIRICHCPYAGFLDIDEVTGVRDGYSWDLFQNISTEMGWTNFFHENEYDFGAMMGRLVAYPWDDPRTCHMAVGGVGILSFRIADGMQFSRPEYRSGFGIVVAATPPTTDMWVFIGVFEWSLWLVLGVASLVIAAIIFFAERDYSDRTGHKSKYSGTKTAGAFEAVHRSLGRVCNAVQDLSVLTVSAKLVSLFWSLTVVILIATYTAALTARQQASNFASSTAISSRIDLPGKFIISYYEFIPLLKQYGFIPEGFRWMGDEDAFNQMQKVATGEADAFILDEGLLQVGIQGRCDLKVISDSFQYRDYGHVFHKLFPYEVILEYNKHMTRLSEDGVFNVLENKYIFAVNEASTCGVDTNDLVVHMTFLGGVWIVMAAGLLVCIAVLLLPNLNSKFDMDVIARMQSMSSVGGQSMFGGLARRNSKVKPTSHNTEASSVSTTVTGSGSKCLYEESDKHDWSVAVDFPNIKDGAHAAATVSVLPATLPVALPSVSYEAGPSREGTEHTEVERFTGGAGNTQSSEKEFLMLLLKSTKAEILAAVEAPSPESLQRVMEMLNQIEAGATRQ